MSNTQQKLRWAAYDAVCKRMLSEKSVLAKILKECVPEFKTCSTDDIVAKYIQGTPEVSTANVMPDETNVPTRISDASIEDTLETEGKITYDIRFNAQIPNSSEQIGLIINIEAQHKYDPGYKIIRRGIYYCSRMISAQHGTVFTNSDYNKIKKVYSIWICTNPNLEDQNTINQYEIKETNILGNSSENVTDYDLLTVILIRLAKEPKECGTEIIDFLTTLLNRFISDKEKTTILHDKYEVKLTDTLIKGAEEMCDLGRGVYYEGVEEGMKQGMQQGMQQGMEQGKTAERIEMLSRYLKTGATIDEAFKLFEITDTAEQARLREALTTA